jgi:ABC-2 type transport system permease protein
MNLILIPIWLLSGAFFPIEGVPIWLAWLIRLNPLTYGMAALRRCLYLGQYDVVGTIPALAPSLAVIVIFALVMLAAATVSAQRSTMA